MCISLGWESPQKNKAKPAFTGNRCGTEGQNYTLVQARAAKVNLPEHSLADSHLFAIDDLLMLKGTDSFGGKTLLFVMFYNSSWSARRGRSQRASLQRPPDLLLLTRPGEGARCCDVP